MNTSKICEHKPGDTLKFGKYKTYTEFIKDATVTEDQLINLITNYEVGACRYVTRHPNCTVKILDLMTKSPLWYVRMVGYFNFRYRTETQQHDIAVQLLKDGIEDKRVLNAAKNYANTVEIMHNIKPLYNFKATE